MNPRFSAAVERTASAAKAPTAAVLAEPAAAAATALVVFPEREARFLAETLAVAPVAVALPGAARRDLEVEPAARFAEAVGKGAAE